MSSYNFGYASIKGGALEVGGIRYIIIAAAWLPPIVRRLLRYDGGMSEM